MSELDILEFEFKEPQSDMLRYIRVIDVFTHHFTGKRMWYVRVDCNEFKGIKATSYFDCIDEDTFRRIASQRVIANVENA